MFRASISNDSKSTCFWAWNGSLDEDELVRQLHFMESIGLAGFFIHSREGLETEYLGPDWDRCVKRVAKEAEKAGLEAWIYDEDRFPSGTCGGKVTSVLDEKYALHGLTIEVSRDYPEELLRASYRARIDGNLLVDLERINGRCELGPDEVYLLVRFEKSAGSVWFNGSAPPDNLSKETVEEFIRTTHKHYLKLLGKGSAFLPGFFSDEPSLADRHAKFNPNRSWMPWSYGMDQYYAQVNEGKDIYDDFPYLFFDGEKRAETRFRYWRTIALRYEECYSKTIASWCRDNHYLFTGHYLQEDKMGLSTRVNGSIMPHYTHQDIPGIDILCEKCDEYMTVKQASSVASQYGKKRVFAETYAACGWDVTLTSLRWIAEWERVLGVTNRVIHQILIRFVAPESATILHSSESSTRHLICF